MRLVHAERRRLRHHYMKSEKAGHTLQTTALANEMCVRLAGLDRLRGAIARTSSPWRRRSMRRVLVDEARKRELATAKLWLHRQASGER